MNVLDKETTFLIDKIREVVKNIKHITLSVVEVVSQIK